MVVWCGCVVMVVWCGCVVWMCGDGGVVVWCFKFCETVYCTSPAVSGEPVGRCGDLLSIQAPPQS